MAANMDLARNLRNLCAEQRSVSEICRKISINRQQFARYLDGAARPSPHNLRRISQYFGVGEAVLTLPHDAFLARISRGAAIRNADPLLAAFPGNARMLRQIAGSYHAHYRSPSQPERIIRALVRIEERHGLFTSATVERTRHPETGQISRARFVGLVSMHDEAIFLVERGRISLGGISETILMQAHRGSQRWFTGLLLGFSWRSRQPYSSACVWKRLRPSLSLREALSACGSLPPDSRELDPLVVQSLDRAGP